MLNQMRAPSHLHERASRPENDCNIYMHQIMNSVVIVYMPVVHACSPVWSFSYGFLRSLGTVFSTGTVFIGLSCACKVTAQSLALSYNFFSFLVLFFFLFFIYLFFFT